MSEPPPIRVLLSVPNNNPKHVVYLPTIWVTLKTYVDHHLPALAGRFDWLPPIILKHNVEELLAPYGDAPIDILGLSCYSWNFNTNMQIAAALRARHPDCLIVAGGPHVDVSRQDFFALHPYVDAVVLKDGEIPFAAMLAQRADGVRALEDIPGLVLPPTEADRATGRLARHTAPPVLPRAFDVSPWLDNSAAIETLIATLRRAAPARPIGIPWETDRGCPYACVFCDWGSNTAGKLRSFPLDRVRAEADWIARNQIHAVFMTVANFGMVAGDEAILEAMIAAKDTHGFPRVFIWNNAKNNVDRVVRMNRRAFDAGLVDFHILSVQSLDDDVLSAMGRADISKQRMLDVCEDVRTSGIPCVAQLIFGGPADTRDRFIGSLTGLMELGIHDEYVAYPFDILPNAPAADAAFQREWGIRTVTRRGSVSKRDPEEETEDYSTFIVATRDSDEAGFVRMYVQGRLIIALHNSGLTKLVSRYLRRTAGIAYRDFYERIMADLFFAPGTSWHEHYRTCLSHIAAFIAPDGEDRLESIPIPDLPELDYWVNVEEYLLYHMMCDVDRFYDDLAAAICGAFGPLPLLASLIDYQRNMIIDPSYDRRKGRTFDLTHDWPSYFAEVDGPRVADPPTIHRTITVSRSHSGSQFQYPLDWWKRAANAGEMRARWVRRIIGKAYQRAERAHFPGIDALSTRDRLAVQLEAAE